jgi:hypothetical protein
MLYYLKQIMPTTSNLKTDVASKSAVTVAVLDRVRAQQEFENAQTKCYADLLSTSKRLEQSLNALRNGALLSLIKIMALAGTVGWISTIIFGISWSKYESQKLNSLELIGKQSEQSIREQIEHLTEILVTRHEIIKCDDGRSYVPNNHKVLFLNSRKFIEIHETGSK